jgi:hyperosmotically inducible periplasmic protein
MAPGLLSDTRSGPRATIESGFALSLIARTKLVDMEVTMRTKLKIVTSALLASGLAIALPAFAQEGSASQPAQGQSAQEGSASQSMHQAGQAVESAASSSGQAAENAAHGTATVFKDSTITAKVKTALHQDDAIAKDKIHVTTVAGVVTLKGKVSSPEESKRAEELAKQTDGVKSVDNRITVAKQSAME